MQCDSRSLGRGSGDICPGGAGQTWPANMLEAGGLFQSLARTDLTIKDRHTLTWDVTEAVRAVQKEKNGTVSFLVRVDYTGPYVAGRGYVFCGSEFPSVECRP